MAEENVVVQSQADMWELIFAFGDSMVLKCAMKLGIADIINKHGSPQIAEEISSSSSLDINYLFQIMRFLVRKRVLTSESKDGHTLYGLTHGGKWLLRDVEFSLAPFLEMQTHEWWLDTWHHLDKCVLEGGVGFDTMTSLIDVGGGTGMMIGEIVKAYPHINGINFDLPHVLATAPEYLGVVHLPGDMFIQIPQANAVIMKWILHDWSDEDCVKILQNCHKAVASNGGKVIIVDAVLDPVGRGAFDGSVMKFDLVMMAHTGGKERTEAEWQILLQDGGFPTYKIIRIPALQSIIEAYPK
ncbi:hypothetical protein AQUCO_05400063v1 [Aquilegia coerulea]|uniref:O-methyltransferase domain-containing protein n=1 Tax=Aquilegia coerulea TaxID=218851 RepID=A0A2G5CHG7_AQUCA|nr:hypothetical protein AQUCO_05400063v1 [Aquilegia coerulea]